MRDQAPEENPWIPACAGMTAIRYADGNARPNAVLPAPTFNVKSAQLRHSWIPAFAGMTGKAGMPVVKLPAEWRAKRASDPLPFLV
jgi:hypothetical protein